MARCIRSILTIIYIYVHLINDNNEKLFFPFPFSFLGRVYPSEIVQRYAHHTCTISFVCAIKKKRSYFNFNPIFFFYYYCSLFFLLFVKGFLAKRIEKNGFRFFCNHAFRWKLLPKIICTEWNFVYYISTLFCYLLQTRKRILINSRYHIFGRIFIIDKTNEIYKDVDGLKQ